MVQEHRAETQTLAGAAALCSHLRDRAVVRTSYPAKGQREFADVGSGYLWRVLPLPDIAFFIPNLPTSSAVRLCRCSCTIGWTLRGACSPASWKLRKLQAQIQGPNQQQMVLSVQRAQAQMSGKQMDGQTYSAT